MTFAEGRKYDGKWKDDMAYGVGVYMGPGFSYDGNWLNGKVLSLAPSSSNNLNLNRCTGKELWLCQRTLTLDSSLRVKKKVPARVNGKMVQNTKVLYKYSHL